MADTPYKKSEYSTMKGSRRIRLLVYPVKAGGSWSNPGKALEIFSDGSRNTTGMTVSCEKSNAGIPNATTVILYNLSEETRESMCLRGLKASIFIADPYTDKELELFAGEILACKSERQGPDIVTTLTILNNYSSLCMPIFTVSKDKAPLRDVLDAFKTAMSLQTVVIKGDAGNRIVKFSFMGTPLDGLNKLALQNAFNWSIDKDVLTIHPDEFSGDLAFRFSSKNGLISAVPILDGPMYAQSGILMRAYPVAWLEPMDRVEIDSKINKKAAAAPQLRVSIIRFDLSTISPQWFMDVTCFRDNPEIFKEA